MKTLLLVAMFLAGQMLTGPYRRLGGSTVLVRGHTEGSAATGSTSINVPWPTGTVSGDLVIIWLNSDFNITNPAGWTQLVLVNGTTWDQIITWKTMTSADITAGSVNVTSAGNADYTFQCTSINGATTHGVREIDGPGSTVSFLNTITTTSATSNTDMGFYSASLRQAGSTVGTVTPTSTILSATSSANVRAQLNVDAHTPGGAYNQTTAYTFGGAGIRFYVVMVKS